MKPVPFEKGQITAQIDAVAHHTMKVDFTWNWPGGVAFYGLGRAWEATQNQEYLDFLKQWVDHYLSIGLPSFTVNAVSMGHTLITLHDATGDDRYLELALKKVEYLNKDALRFGDRVFQHTVSAKNDFPEQAWADTLFMAAYFLLRMGRKLDKPEWVEDALRQWYWHEEYLQDEVSNLYFHGWDNVAKNHMSGILWARGNAWAAYTMAQALRHITYLYPMFMTIEGSLRDQLSALVRLQAPDGLWHTVLTDPESYTETSASSGIAAAIALNGHPLHAGCLQKAYQGISGRITEDGKVRGVSGGTGVMHTVADYRAIPHKRVQGWGQGLTLAFLSALISTSGNGGSSV